MAKTSYKNVLELVYNPLEFNKELNTREKIVKNSFYDLSLVVVLDFIPDTKIDIFCDSKVFEDVKESFL